MAKIFRKIRQRWLAKNKVKNYLIYAIGEIMLVVIGILLALQINSMNQNWQRAKLEKVLLYQVKFEIQEIYADIWRDIGILTMGSNSHTNINKYLIEDWPYTDSLCFDFYWIKKDEYVYPANAAYSRIKEEGLDIIQVDTLRTLIQSLYEGHFPRLLKSNAFNPDISATFDDYYLNSFTPNINAELQFEYPLANDTVGSKIYTDVYYRFPKIDTITGDKEIIGYVPLDFEALKKDPKFRMLLVQTQQYRNTKYNRYAIVKNTIKEIVQLIEKELESYKEN